MLLPRRSGSLLLSQSQPQFSQRLPAIATPNTYQIRPIVNLLNNLYKKLFNKSIGTSDEEHAVNRIAKHDATDPETEASNEGLSEREESEGIANGNKSQATTERGGLASQRKAKVEHPKAPEPVIGMNDERAQVSFFFLLYLVNYPWVGVLEDCS